MRVFRLSKKKYANELSGKGAALSTNRWSSKGTEMVYTAESRALAMAEVVVHLTLATLPSDYMMMEIDIPEEVDIHELEPSELTANWNGHPPTISTQRIGDAFIHDQAYCVMKVPSAVVKGDANYLLNPHHPDFKKIKIVSTTAFPFDKRIFK